MHLIHLSIENKYLALSDPSRWLSLYEARNLSLPGRNERLRWHIASCPNWPKDVYNDQEIPLHHLHLHRIDLKQQFYFGAVLDNQARFNSEVQLCRLD